jgi:glycosyltransferase involved in cell wall biosynthesis
MSGQMLKNSLLEIPGPSNANASGWPWDTYDAIPSERTVPASLPLISIIIPSFNQGQFIEETIRSIILQAYGNLELIVIDGGSSDNTVNVIRKYEKWVTYWVSEKDSGQASAINKGLALARGEIIKWLNSDDLLLPGALLALSTAYLKNRDRFFVSPVEHFLDGTNKRRVFKPMNVTHRELVEFWSGRLTWNDPGTFYTREVINKVGVIDDSYRYSFDYEFVLRVSKHFEVLYLNKPAAAFRVHSNSKTISEGEKFIYETAKVSQKYWDELEHVDRSGFQKYFAITMFRNGIRNVLRHPAAAAGYFAQGFTTNLFFSGWWLAVWGLKMVKSRIIAGDRDTSGWSGFGVE